MLCFWSAIKGKRRGIQRALDGLRDPELNQHPGGRDFVPEVIGNAAPRRIFSASLLMVVFSRRVGMDWASLEQHWPLPSLVFACVLKIKCSFHTQQVYKQHCSTPARKALTFNSGFARSSRGKFSIAGWHWGEGGISPGHTAPACFPCLLLHFPPVFSSFVCTRIDL